VCTLIKVSFVTSTVDIAQPDRSAVSFVHVADVMANVSEKIHTFTLYKVKQSFVPVNNYSVPNDRHTSNYDDLVIFAVLHVVAESTNGNYLQFKQTMKTNSKCHYRPTLRQLRRSMPHPYSTVIFGMIPVRCRVCTRFQCNDQGI